MGCLADSSRETPVTEFTAKSRPAFTGVFAPDGLPAHSQAGMMALRRRAYPVCQPTPGSCRRIRGCSHRRIPPSIYRANRCTRRRPSGQSGRNVTTGSNRFSSWSERARVIVVVAAGVFRSNLDGRGFVFIAPSHFLCGGLHRLGGFGRGSRLRLEGVFLRR